MAWSLHPAHELVVATQCGYYLNGILSANDGASIPLELEEVTQFGKVIRLEKADTFGAVACIDMLDPLLDYLYTLHRAPRCHPQSHLDQVR
jgi:hypothetical protein